MKIIFFGHLLQYCVIICVCVYLLEFCCGFSMMLFCLFFYLELFFFYPDMPVVQNTGLIIILVRFILSHCSTNQKEDATCSDGKCVQSEHRFSSTYNFAIGTGGTRSSSTSGSAGIIVGYTTFRASGIESGTFRAKAGFENGHPNIWHISFFIVDANHFSRALTIGGAGAFVLDNFQTRHGTSESQGKSNTQKGN